MSAVTELLEASMQLIASGYGRVVKKLTLTWIVSAV